MDTALQKNVIFESNNAECTFYRNNKVVVTGHRSPNETIFLLHMKIKAEPVEKVYIIY